MSLEEAVPGASGNPSEMEARLGLIRIAAEAIPWSDVQERYLLTQMISGLCMQAHLPALVAGLAPALAVIERHVPALLERWQMRYGEMTAEETS